MAPPDTPPTRVEDYPATVPPLTAVPEEYEGSLFG